MSQIKIRTSEGANPSKAMPATYLLGGWQAYSGPGLLRALILDHISTSGNVLKAYDGFSSSDIQIFTRTSETDAGTTVPITCYTNGDLPDGTSTDNVKAGVPFARGLFFNKTGDTTHDLKVTAFITPLIRKDVQVRWVSGAAGSGIGVANVFSGPGLLHGYRIKSDTLTPSTTDFLLKDSALIDRAAGTGSGNTLMTKTDYGYAAEAVRPVVTLTGSDEGGTAVSTAATGAYASPGIFFGSGLNVSVQQANAQDAIYQFEFLIEA